MSDNETEEPRVRGRDRAASGAPVAGRALGDRFSWAEIHHRVLAEADEEISSSLSELFFSGFTAGFAMVLTFMGYAVGLGLAPESPFVAALLSPLGFVFIVLGQYQLYTEKTLPPVKLVLTRLASLPLLLRLWAVVLVANIVGAGAGAAVLATTQVLSPEAMEAGAGVVTHATELPWSTVFFKSVFAGWLVAVGVWVIAAARDTVSRLLTAYLVFYSISVLELYHVISGAAEALFHIFWSGAGGPGAGAVLVDFWLPVLLGNTAGGVVLLTLISYAQSEQRRFPEIRELSTRELLFSLRGGQQYKGPRPGPPSDGTEDD